MSTTTSGPRGATRLCRAAAAALLLASLGQAPAFLLGAVFGFVSVLMGRMKGVVDRIRTVNAIAADGAARVSLNADLPRLVRRAQLFTGAILLAVGSAICTTLLLLIAFVIAFLGYHHEVGAGFMFVMALALLGASLVALAREVRIAPNEYEHYG
jgi:hypothetical protein